MRRCPSRRPPHEGMVSSYQMKGMWWTKEPWASGDHIRREIGKPEGSIRRSFCFNTCSGPLETQGIKRQELRPHRLLLASIFCRAVKDKVYPTDGS